jgi:hypothetical protein
MWGRLTSPKWVPAIAFGPPLNLNKGGEGKCIGRSVRRFYVLPRGV